MAYRTGPHTKYKIEYHFVWIPKYRYQLLKGDIEIRLRELIRQTCAMDDIEYCVELTKQMIEEYLEHYFEAKDNPNFEIKK